MAQLQEGSSTSLQDQAETRLRVEHEDRAEACRAFKEDLLQALAPPCPRTNGDPTRTLPSVLNLSFSELDSEAVILAVKNIVSISNGSACTSNSYQPSHVLQAMGMSSSEAEFGTRWSWSHLTPRPQFDQVREALSHLL